mgnify:CR=1 FL=1
MTHVTEAEVLVYLIGVLLPVFSLYIINKTKIKESEHRQTVNEMEIEQLIKRVDQNVQRLNEHEEQNKSLYILAEQIKSLTETVVELKQDIKLLHR